MENYRRFTAVDPYGRTWQIEFRWQQNGISIRHADTIDVKFQLMRGEDVMEKVIAAPHPDLLFVSKSLERQITDSWVMKLGALHLKEMLETDRDMEKTLVTANREDLMRHARKLQEPVPVRR